MGRSERPGPHIPATSPAVHRSLTRGRWCGRRGSRSPGAHLRHDDPPVQTADAWVPPVAAAQGGAFTRRQAVEAGASVGHVRWQVRTGRWVPVVGAALRSSSWTPDEVTLLHAAHLTWPDGVVAFSTAARVHRIPVHDDGRVHVVLPISRLPRGRLTPHRVALDADDVTTVLGVPVTTRRRTILDCLGRLPEGSALDLLAWVASRRLLTSSDLEAWLATHPGRWGNGLRTEALRRLRTGAVNPGEDRLHTVLRRGGVTGWTANASLLATLGVAAVVDVYFPAVRLVVELDGRRAHGAAAFQADRTRQNALVAARCTVLRYTWDDVVRRPDMVVAQIRSALAALAASAEGL